MPGWSRRVRVEMQKCAVNQTPTAQNPQYTSFSSTNPLDDGSGATEPTGTGSGRKSISWNTVVAGSLNASVDASNSGSITWTSGAAWSSGATALGYLCFWNASSGTAESVFCGYLQVASPQAVNASGITLTIAASAIVMSCSPT